MSRSIELGAGGKGVSGSGARGPGVARVSGTIALHGTRDPARRSGPLVAPLVQSTSWAHSAVGRCDGPTYARVGNPTVDELERVLGALEDAPPAACFASGLAAETALFLALLRAGDHAVVGEAIYGGTVRLFRQVLRPLGIGATFVDTSDPGQVAAAINPRTKLVFIETPANPTLRLTDIAAIARIARFARVPLAVDNTFLTAVIQRPLDLGADISVYSTTKHIDGHSSALGGAIVTRDEPLLERIRFVRKATGNIQAPFNAFLTTRGIKTLPLRIRAQSEAALGVARALADDDRVERVHYPGLPGFPQAALAAKQHAGGLHGGVVTFEPRGGAEAGRALLDGLALCTLAEHVGSVETLITHPATMTHADVPVDQRLRVGITDGLVRLSVGLEDSAQIIADLDRGLDAAAAVAASAEKGAAACAPTN
ncbi:MAG: aminotransferase class I/II-fold pyridoxal phosphate-dependent enzyme [Phycisphaeraceae bacterium]|nr:aminotransferase class I/II-fold pyridoxal phosphate-dependent enzyme [Phycisphaeraceae bacterium]